MVNERGAVNAARTLLNSPKTSEGFTELYLRGKRLDLSVEAIVLRIEHQGLFSSNELATARQRLRDVGYPVPGGETSQSVNNVIEREAVPSEGFKYQNKASTTLPPISDAEGLIARIQSVIGQPERNVEDVVKDLLLRLGHPVNRIVFQRGRIDLILQDDSGKPSFVFEVKRSIASEAERAAARRQAMDYACQTGAPFLVITDADRYEIYDRRRGLDFDAMFSGRFQLTHFDEASTQVLDLLRYQP